MYTLNNLQGEQVKEGGLLCHECWLKITQRAGWRLARLRQPLLLLFERLNAMKININMSAPGVGEDSNDECCICGSVSISVCIFWSHFIIAYLRNAATILNFPDKSS